RLAQQLYEGIEIKGNGTVGLITYLRTDSTRVSEEARRMAEEYIGKNYGENYVGKEPEEAKGGRKVQDAHEAIRPTDLNRTPASMKDSLSRDQLRLYQLIWKRFVAGGMQPAKYETTSIKIDAGEHRFTVAASRMIFDGFTCVYAQDEDKAENNLLAGAVTEETPLTLEGFEEKQHFTQPSPHYTEASLVRALEELGIGRPSTYAPTITTLLARRYIVKENRNLYVTEIGEVVNHMMQEAFPSVVDVNFTANMEALLDSVAEGSVAWKTIVSNFYPDLDEAVKTAEKELEQVETKDEVSDEVCDLCGRQMVIKYGPHGRFLACPGFPECRSTKPFYEKTGVPCPKCGKDIVLKMTRKGRKYYGCIDNPDCDFMIWQKPSLEKCKKCGSMMVHKGNKLVCTGENCDYVSEISEKTEKSENS
ncbi:MAG: topoisomerase DNA-binding C4 zinc finger domain-containing protein, partial [Lachnospiraceae bacterium]|nr:topoisomerase DNA-binding C4 zinc finger domain-containing protein [Lachnospiraceae bacterium]